MSWPWVSAQIAGMAAGEFKQLNTNYPWDVALARTRANFDAGSTWTDDAAVLGAINAASASSMTPYSGPSVNPENGNIKWTGGGHADSGDGSIFDWDPSSSFAWTLEHASPKIDNAGTHQITCSITAISTANPAIISVDADIALTGDQGVITGTTDADGTYQLVRVDATHVALYNIDGAYDVGYTSFDGAGLTNSTGTLTIDVNPHVVDGANYWAHPNKDGEQMPPCRHTHFWKWIGGNKWLLSGRGVFDGGTGGSAMNRIWIKDGAIVYRSYHDVCSNFNSTCQETNYGGPWRMGPYCWSPTLQRVVGFSGNTRNFQSRCFAWESGYNGDSDFQKVYSVANVSSATMSGVLGADMCELVDPTSTSHVGLFSFDSTTAFNYCSQLNGTPALSSRTFSGTPFFTDMNAIDTIGVCYDSVNDEIIYWGGGSTIGKITLNSNLDAWTATELTPGTPTGDVPVLADYPTSAKAIIVKVPDYDAYLLAKGGDVFLYLRSITLGVAQESDSALAITPAKAVQMGVAQESDSALAIDAATGIFLGIAQESDSALAITPAKAVQMGVAQESDSALTVNYAKGVTPGIAQESDSALAITPAKAVQMGVAQESDSALAIDAAKGRILGIAQESDSALTLTPITFKYKLGTGFNATVYTRGFNAS